MTDRLQCKPGLVALYDIRPGNGAGPFLQPRNLHGAAKALGGSFKLVTLTPKPVREMTALTALSGQIGHSELVSRV